LFFNIVESYAGDDTMRCTAAHLDLLMSYTGAGPQDLTRRRTRAWPRSCLSQHSHAVLRHLLPGQAGPFAGHFFPLTVKPEVKTDRRGSIKAVVGSVKELMERTITCRKNSSRRR
jgi:hypothetical protein